MSLAKFTKIYNTAEALRLAEVAPDLLEKSIAVNAALTGLVSVIDPDVGSLLCTVVTGQSDILERLAKMDIPQKPGGSQVVECMRALHDFGRAVKAAGLQQ